ncbi:unnamed protein product [Wuchereria bancrofti]|uniref:RRM domain-containing protein n=2 Tax=Wuchereria bancrofti TaxID=6293 RepID=A0A3P7F1M4_WUCBA|nr:unnamed protein product [Wuchereria bancrofti]
MNKAKNTTTDVDLGVIPETIAQVKNIWSCDSSDNQVSIPDLVLQSFPGNGIFSRKVFVGGLPPDVTANSLSLFFEQFGANTVDWPHRKCTGSDIPPNGYAFVVFISDRSVEYLVSRCICKQGKLNILLKNGEKEVKVVQVRPWALSDQVYRMTDAKPLSDRFSVFIGGVPRTTTASELAMLLQQTIGDVVYVSLEVDAETRYPKGAAQVVFDNRESYLTAIAMRLITLTTVDQVKEVSQFFLIFNYYDDKMATESCRLTEKVKAVLANQFVLRSTNQQQLCHCRVRETLPLQRLLQQYIMQANHPPCHHSSFI